MTSEIHLTVKAQATAEGVVLNIKVARTDNGHSWNLEEQSINCNEVKPVEAILNRWPAIEALISKEPRDYSHLSEEELRAKHQQILQQLIQSKSVADVEHE